jgi:uncharacterized protein
VLSPAPCPWLGSKFVCIVIGLLVRTFPRFTSSPPKWLSLEERNIKLREGKKNLFATCSQVVPNLFPVENRPCFLQSGAMKRSWILAPLVAGALCGGCGGCKKPAEALAPPATDPGEPTAAQARLPTLKLYLGNEEMVAELALTPQQERTGMMFRTNMAENAGMLFVFDEPQTASFWMKNCPLPLSIAYIDSDGIIREVHDMERYNTNSVVSASGDIRFALETPQGWFQRHHVGPGVAVATERGTLRQTFLKRP